MTWKQDLDGKYSVLDSYTCITNSHERITYVLMKYFVVRFQAFQKKKPVFILSFVSGLCEFPVSGLYLYIPCA